MSQKTKTNLCQHLLRKKKLVCWAPEKLKWQDVSDTNANVVVASKADGVPAPLTDRYLSLITAFCSAHRLQVAVFLLAFKHFPVPMSGFLVAMLAFQVSPSSTRSAPLPAHAGADNKGVHRGISAAAKAQRGARSCERSTHAEVTHLVVTRRVAG